MTNRIRELRKARGLTLKQLADLIGDVNFTTVGRWERGQSPLTSDWMKKIAHALDVSAVELLEHSRDGRKIPLVDLRDSLNPVIHGLKFDPVVIGHVTPAHWQEDAYAVHAKYLPGINDITELFETLIVNRHVDELRAGHIYLLREKTGKLHARIFFETPPRFEPRSSDRNERIFKLGNADVQVIGHIVQPAGPLRASMENRERHAGRRHEAAARHTAGLVGGSGTAGLGTGTSDLVREEARQERTAAVGRQSKNKNPAPAKKAQVDI